MALTAKNMPYKDRFGPFAPEVYRVRDQLPLPRRPPGRGGRGGRASPRSSRTSERATSPPSSSSRSRARAGSSCPPRGSSPALSAWCTASGALFIADEIQTGFCRTGAWFASEHEGVVPDLVATAKGIAAGLPLAGGHRPPRRHGRRARGRPRRHLRGEPGRVRGGARRDRGDATRRPRREGALDRGARAAPPRGPRDVDAPASARSAGAVRCSRSSSSCPAPRRPTPPR